MIFVVDWDKNFIFRVLHWQQLIFFKYNTDKKRKLKHSNYVLEQCTWKYKKIVNKLIKTTKKHLWLFHSIVLLRAVLVIRVSPSVVLFALMCENSHLWVGSRSEQRIIIKHLQIEILSKIHTYSGKNSHFYRWFQMVYYCLLLVSDISQN